MKSLMQIAEKSVF